MSRAGMVKKAGEFFLLNLAAPSVFFIVFRLEGAKPAIAFAVLVSVLQGLAHRIRGIPMSPIYIVASGFTVLFGGIDLFLASPRVFKLEPFAQNFVMGVVFLASLARQSPILAWFASGLPEPIRPHPDAEGMAYLRKLTWIWAIYFLLKALFFLWIAYQVDLGSLILIRSAVGGGTLFLLVTGELIYRKVFRQARLRRSAQSGSARLGEEHPSGGSQFHEESPHPR